MPAAYRWGSRPREAKRRAYGQMARKLAKKRLEPNGLSREGCANTAAFMGRVVESREQKHVVSLPSCRGPCGVIAAAHKGGRFSRYPSAETGIANSAVHRDRLVTK